MAEHPIIYDSESIRAILAGRKTQTRRVVRLQGANMWQERTPNGELNWFTDVRHKHGSRSICICPYGGVDDILWVREAWCETDWKPGTSLFPADPRTGFVAAYRADYDPARPFPAPWTPEWKSPIYMPRWASRLSLQITDVRVQRLRAITEEDAIAEGVESAPLGLMIVYRDYGRSGSALASVTKTARYSYETRWNCINGKRAPWAENPWVWALSYKICGGKT